MFYSICGQNYTAVTRRQFHNVIPLYQNNALQLWRPFGVLKHKKVPLLISTPTTKKRAQFNHNVGIHVSTPMSPTTPFLILNFFQSTRTCWTEMSSSFSEKTDFCRLPTAITFPNEALVKYLKEYICCRKMSYMDYVRQGPYYVSVTFLQNAV